MNARLGGLVACLALLTAACGHPAKATHTQAKGTSPYQQAVAFAACMRTHGDPSFPDPGPDGAFPNDNGSLDKSSPRFKKAAAACKDLEPGGPPDAVFQRDYRQLLKYAACMRAHGMADFPDPVLEDHGVGFTGRPIDKNSTRFRTANQACRSLQPPGGAL